MKKKNIASLVLLCITIATLRAQTEKGYFFLSPQITAFDLSGDDNSLGNEVRFKFGLGIDGGSFIAKNLAALVGVSIQIDRQNQMKDHELQLSVGLRYYLFSRLFIGGKFAYEKRWLQGYDSEMTRKRDYFLFNADLGYAIFLKPNLSIDPAIYWKYSFADRLNQYGLKIGFNVYF